jgi:hypothetical protein
MRLHRAICAGMICLGILGLITPSVLLPAHIPANWLAFLPYILLSIGALTIRESGEMKPFLGFTAVLVVLGTWAYWDGLRFNLVFSWNVFGLVQEYVPIVQLCLIGAWLCIAVMRRVKKRKLPRAA